MDYWGRTGGFSLVLPYALIDTSAGPFRASTNGFSDVGFLWQMNIFGGPALTREQFQFFIPQTFSSFHLLVTTPLGTYNPTSPINPSANRWMISPTVNFSYTPDQGWTWIETYVSGQSSATTAMRSAKAPATRSWNSPRCWCGREAQIHSQECWLGTVAAAP
jgi:hypothetical protein